MLTLMEQLSLRTNELLETLIGKISQLESDNTKIRDLILEKVNPEKKEYLDDDEMNSIFGLSYHVINNLVRKEIIFRYKLGGKMSKSFYKYSEVLEQIGKGIVMPKSKN